MYVGTLLRLQRLKAIRSWSLVTRQPPTPSPVFNSSYLSQWDSELPHFGFQIFHTRKPSIILTNNINVLPLTVWNFQHLFPTFKQHLIIFLLIYVTGQWLSYLLLWLHWPSGHINRFTMDRHYVYNQCLILIHSQSTL